MFQNSGMYHQRIYTYGAGQKVDPVNLEYEAGGFIFLESGSVLRLEG